MTDSDTAISVRGLTKIFGSRTVVDHFDMDVPKGAIYGFLGPNGSGKTSFLEAIYLLSRARSFRTHNIKKVINSEESNLLVFEKLEHTGVKNKIAIKKDPQETTIRINDKTEKKIKKIRILLKVLMYKYNKKTTVKLGELFTFIS